MNRLSFLQKAASGLFGIGMIPQLFQKSQINNLRSNKRGIFTVSGNHVTFFLEKIERSDRWISLMKFLIQPIFWVFLPVIYTVLLWKVLTVFRSSYQMTTQVVDTWRSISSLSIH